jgi:hypothetical protein
MLRKWITTLGAQPCLVELLGFLINVTNFTAVIRYNYSREPCLSEFNVY